MNSLRIKIEMRKGKRGIPLSTLEKATHETKKFLQMLCIDLGIIENVGDWIAENFENASVDYDCASVGLLDDRSQRLALRALECVMGNTFEDEEINVLVNHRTRLQYARIINPFSSDEQVGFGLYRDADSKTPYEWFYLNKASATSISKENIIGKVYHGEMQGIVHALYKESKQPKLVVRHLASGDLVDCFFPIDMYHSAIEVLEEKDAVIIVEGLVNENILTGHPESIEVTDFKLAPPFDASEFSSLIGSIPNISNGMTTDEFISFIRDYELD